MKNYLSLLALMIGIELCFGQDSTLNSTDSNACIHGQVEKYFSNGNLKSYRTYEHGFLYGPYMKYYRNGEVKEKGFLDDVNEWNLRFQPSKVVKEKYRKNGEFKKSVEGKINPIKPVPYGKCQCEDDNVQRIRSLLIGTWVKEKMIPFSKEYQIIDSVFSHYTTKITFFKNDSLSISINDIQYSGRYYLTSNTLKLQMKKGQDNWEYLISMRWPKKTLYPNSTGEHFDLELIEVLNVLTEDEKVILSNVIVKFKRIKDSENRH